MTEIDLPSNEARAGIHRIWEKIAQDRKEHPEDYEDGAIGEPPHEDSHAAQLNGGRGDG